MAQSYINVFEKLLREKRNLFRWCQGTELRFIKVWLKNFEFKHLKSHQRTGDPQLWWIKPHWYTVIKTDRNYVGISLKTRLACITYSTLLMDHSHWCHNGLWMMCKVVKCRPVGKDHRWRRRTPFVLILSSLRHLWVCHAAYITATDQR